MAAVSNESLLCSRSEELALVLTRERKMKLGWAKHHCVPEEEEESGMSGYCHSPLDKLYHGPGCQ